MRLVHVLLIFLPLAGVGCGTNYHPVSGRVTLDGAPVTDAGIMFHPVAAGPVGSAVTDSNGTYRLVMANQGGALAGEYHVTITKQRLHGVKADETLEDQGARVEWLVPQRYSDKDKSGLKVAVPAQPGSFDFQLSSQ